MLLQVKRMVKTLKKKQKKMAFKILSNWNLFYMNFKIKNF